MAETSIKLDPALSHSFEDILLPNQSRSCGRGSFSMLRVGRADHCNAQVRFDGVRQAHAVADGRAVFEGAQADVQFVLARVRLAADFCCAEKSTSPYQLVFALFVS